MGHDWRIGDLPHANGTYDTEPPFEEMPGLLDGMRVDWPRFWSHDRSDEQWLLGPVLPAGRAVAIIAANKAGKSLVSLLMLAPAVLGRPVLARPAGDPLRVLYLDLEMSEDDLQNRLLDMGFDDDYTPEQFAYLLHPPLPPLDTEAGGNLVLDLALEHRADLVVLDTASRIISGDENDAHTYSELWRHTIAPLKAAGITSLRIDHAGHSDANRARGSSAKGSDVDVAWILKPADNGWTLHRQLSRITWVPERVDLRLERDPDRLAQVPILWPDGTKEMVERLDRLGVPIDATRRAAAKILRDAGETGRNGTIGAALKWRKRLPDAVIHDL